MSATSRARVVAAATTTAGLALFGVLVYQTGPATIAASVRACGATFVALVVLSGIRHLLRTIAWQLCIDPAHRVVSFLDLFNIRLAAEAVTDLTFAGPVLGESVKALAMSRRIPATDSFSSIVIENLAYSVSVVLFVMSGVVVFLLGTALPQGTRFAVLGVGLALLTPIAAIQLAVSRRFLVLSAALDRLERRGVRLGPLERRRAKIREFEGRVVDFYTGRKGAVAALLAIELITNVTGVLEAYLILGVVEGHTSLYAGYLVESVNRVVNAVFPFLPLRVGVDEGGAALVFRALGYTTAAGVSLAVIRKIRSIFWIGVGLACMARYAVRGAGGTARAESEDAAEAPHRQRR